MSMSDPLADLLTRIRNGHIAKHDRVDVPVSKLKLQVCRILAEEGFVQGFKVVESTPTDVIRVFLRYDKHGTAAISRLARVSRPGRRVYRGAHSIPAVLNGLGVGIVSTSQGVLTDQEARERGIGGEIICEVW